MTRIDKIVEYLLSHPEGASIEAIREYVYGVDTHPKPGLRKGATATRQHIHKMKYCGAKRDVGTLEHLPIRYKFNPI